jgi:hypothetical protein
MDEVEFSDAWSPNDYIRTAATKHASSWQRDEPIRLAALKHLATGPMKDAEQFD